MENYDRCDRPLNQTAGSKSQAQSARAQSAPDEVSRDTNPGDQLSISFSKGPKRKRLAKACDPCHKSKRRCDGTAPCSNCYFASKPCTYTDASGRPVPAPRNMPPESVLPPGQLETFVHAGPQTFQSGERSPSQSIPEHGDGDQSTLRKRFRSDRGQAIAPPEPIARNPVPPQSVNAVFDHFSGLDPALTRELVNLFFTHRHPQRIIIHKPSFSAALSHNRVPAYLLHAVCALAAPFSKQPRIRTQPARIAGQPFAQAAAALMFDNVGRLICEPNLATAQALCLLQVHETIAKPSWTSRYHDIALEVLESLGVHKPDNPVFTPVPSPEFIHSSIERECVRRIFWLIHFVDLTSSIYFKTSLLPKEDELMLRLPADETSFELSAHSTVPEYLHLPAPRMQYASEFGHLIRITSIYAKVEAMMDASKKSEQGEWFLESERAVESWVSSLPDHLRFSEDSLQVQLSMFETSSNTGAWSFCCMHVVHASCMLALNAARQRGQRASAPVLQWAVTRLDHIMTSLGTRAKKSLILSCVLWPLIKYCQRDDAQIRAWSTDHEEIWGIRMQDCVSLDRRQQWPPQPPQQFRAPSELRLAPQQQRELGRALNDLRLENRGNHTGSTTPRSISDANIDPTLQGGSGQRSGEGPPSLPSLKSSGLLDSWSAPNDLPSVPTLGQVSRNTTSNVRADTQPSPQTSPSRSSYQSNSEPSRIIPSGMPVGMAWLANESTSSR